MYPKGPNVGSIVEINAILFWIQNVEGTNYSTEYQLQIVAFRPNSPVKSFKLCARADAMETLFGLNVLLKLINK